MRLIAPTPRLLAAAGLAVAALLLFADPAMAAEAPKEGEDKLGFLGLKRYDLGIYTLIVFGLLLFILSKYAWPHISEGLKKREAAIIGAREEAQGLLDQGVDALSVGRAAILDPDWPARVAREGRPPIRGPRTAEQLAEVAISPSFVEYLRRFRGLVA